MNIVGTIIGLMVTVFSETYIGWGPAFVAGVIVGALISVSIVTIRKGGAKGVNRNSESQVNFYIAQAKKIQVNPNDANYYAEIISGVESGNSLSCWNLGHCYLSGRLSLLPDTFPKDKNSAQFWLIHSAEMGDSSCQYHLAIMYLGDEASRFGLSYSDDIIVKNTSEAIKWLELASRQNDMFSAMAQDLLGEMYFLGAFVKMDRARAFELFSSSVTNTENMSMKMGLGTRAGERLPMLEAEGYR